MFKNIGLCITGSHCTFDKTISMISELKEKGYNIIPILSFVASTTDTRFYNAEDFIKKVEEAAENRAVLSIVEAEPLGPKNALDVIVVLPCTGNTLAKLASAITDTPVTMAVKAHIRNNKPVVIAISTNDALGFNLQNIAKLMVAKNFYFVPFRQDDHLNKPKSLIADFSFLDKTLLLAYEGKQIQPLIISNQ